MVTTRRDEKIAASKRQSVFESFYMSVSIPRTLYRCQVKNLHHHHHHVLYFMLAERSKTICSNSKIVKIKKKKNVQIKL